MRYEEKEVTLRNGDSVVLRSPRASDAEAMLHYLHQTSGETDFLVRYPEEIEVSPEKLREEEEFLEMMVNSPCNMMIAAFRGDELLGNIGLNCVGERRKIRHRCSIGIAVVKEAWGIGLGRMLMEAAARSAGELGFEMVEMGVMDGNDSAHSLYLSMGFQEYGRMPHAFKLADGSYRDEILMFRCVK